MKTSHEISADFNAIADALSDTPARNRLTPSELALLPSVLERIEW